MSEVFWRGGITSLVLRIIFLMWSWRVSMAWKDCEVKGMAWFRLMHGAMVKNITTTLSYAFDRGTRIPFPRKVIVLASIPGCSGKNLAHLQHQWNWRDKGNKRTFKAGLLLEGVFMRASCWNEGLLSVVRKYVFAQRIHDTFSARFNYEGRHKLLWLCTCFEVCYRHAQILPCRE